jgi:hypothetical protein
MILLFGGWHAYKRVPSRVVQEQTLVWIAQVQAEAELNRKAQKETNAQPPKGMMG